MLKKSWFEEDQWLWISWLYLLHKFMPKWMYNKVTSHFTLWCHKPVPHKIMFQCTSKILIVHIHWPPTKQNDSTVDIDDERCVSNATFSYINLVSFIWLNFYQQWSALHTVDSLLWNKHSTRLVCCMSYPVVLISFRDIFFPSFSLIHATKHKKWEKENSDKIHNHGNKRSQKQKTFGQCPTVDVQEYWYI